MALYKWNKKHVEFFILDYNEFSIKLMPVHPWLLIEMENGVRLHKFTKRKTKTENVKL